MNRNYELVKIKKFLEEVKAAREIVEAGEKAKTLSLIERRKSEREAAKEAEKQRCLAIARKLAEEKAVRDAAEASACPGKGFIVGDNGQWVYDPKAETRMDIHSKEWYLFKFKASVAEDVTPKDPVFNHMEPWEPTCKYDMFWLELQYKKAVKEYPAKGWKVPRDKESFLRSLWTFDAKVYDRYHTPKWVWKEFFKRYKALYDQPYEENPVEFSKWLDLSEVQPPNGRYQHELLESVRDPYAPDPYRGGDWMERQVGDLSHLMSMKEKYKDDYPLMMRKFFRELVEKLLGVKCKLNYSGTFNKGHPPTSLDIVRAWCSALDLKRLPRSYNLKLIEKKVEAWIDGLSGRQVARYLKMARQEYPLAKEMGHFFPIVLCAIGKSLARAEANLGYEYEVFCRRTEQEQIKFELGLKSEYRPAQDEFAWSEGEEVV